MTKTIEVEIYGQRYSIRGDADEHYVRQLANFVDGHMRALSQGMKTSTLARLAVLAAINIAHQLFQSERLRQQDEEAVERRMHSLMESIEEQMPSSLLQ